MEGYDPSTGQVYVETSAPVGSMVSSWMNNCTGKEEDPKTYRHPRQGPDSLYHMTLRTCTWNIYDRGMPQTLPYYDWEIMKLIYQRLKKTDTLTFKAWAIFQTAFPKKINSNYRVLIAQENGGLGKIDSIRKQVSSLSFDTLTFLCIRNLQISLVNLNTDLLKFTNLSVLVLEQLGGKRGGGEDDKIIKNWGRSVNQAGAFKKLKVLMLKHFDISAEEALRGVTVFPAVILCNLDAWLVKQDMKPFMASGSRYTHINKRWCSLLDNAENPERIWTRKDITTHEKMKKLYDFAAEWGLKNFSIEVPPSEPIISIHYGQTNSIVYHSRASAWFIRVVPVEREEEAVPAKRQPDPEGGNKDPANKKKRVRSGKQKEVGSLLGDFGL